MRMKEKNRVVSVFTLIAVLFAMLFMDCSVVNAETSSETHVQKEKDFSEYTPISTKEELNNIRYDSDGKYYLVCDIVFNEEDFEEGGAFYNDGKGWIPISWQGVFDGNGHVVKGIKIKASSNRGGSYGLFSSNSGTIYNLGVEAGVIEVNSSQKGSSVTAGGLVGVNYGTIRNCFNANKIVVNSWSVNAGGVVGMNSGISEQEIAEVLYCYNAGKITATASAYESESGCRGYVGGVVGFTNDGNSGRIECCYNSGDINLNVLSTGGTTNLYGKYKAEAKAYAGGCTNGGDAVNCYNSGTIEVVSKGKVKVFAAECEAYAYVGGIAGFLSNGTSIENCYNAGELFGESIALNMHGDSNDPYCVNETYIGGVAGEINDNGNARNCYYLDLVTNGVGSGNNAGVKLSAAQLQEQSNLIGFDFDTIWGLSKSEKYQWPVLKELGHVNLVIPSVVIPDSAAITEDGEFWYEIINYNSGRTCARIIRYVGDKVNVTIPNTIEGYTVDYISESAFEDSKIESISGDTIEFIDFSAFKNCTKLKKVDFPKVKSVFSNDYTWENGELVPNTPFENCKSLTEIKLPSLESVSAYTFLGCRNLQTVIFPSLKTVWPHAFNVTMNEDGSEPTEKSDIENLYIPCKGVGFSAGKSKYVEHIRELHNYGEWKTTKEPTCLAVGEKERVCTLCQNKETEEIAIDSTAHNYGEWKTTKGPTCSAVGEKERVCTLCQNKETEEIAIDSTAHNYGEWITTKAPTCSAVGEKERVCTLCQNKETMEIPIDSTAHTYGEWVITQNATCTTPGQRERICSSCKGEDTKQTEVIPIDLTAHNYGEWITTKAPTCSAVGEKERVCTLCQNKETEEIAIDSTAHSFTKYVYNNDAKVGVDGTETAVCDYGCGVTNTRIKEGSALDDGGGSWVPLMQYPNISEGDGYITSLSNRGRKVTITVDEDYELVDVSLNGESKGIVTELSGLRTGDEVIITVISKVEKIQQELKGVNWKNFLTRSAQVKMKNGKKAIRLTFINNHDVSFDGIEVFRSMKKNSGYGTKPIFTTTNDKYYNTAIKKGKRYYYKARGYIEYDGVKYYSGWSAKAWRMVK